MENSTEAALALGIHLDNKQKRKASAIGAFLNVATQRKLIKMATNHHLELELDYAAQKFYDLKMENEELKAWCLGMQDRIASLTRHVDNLGRRCCDREADIRSFQSEVVRLRQKNVKLCSVSSYVEGIFFCVGNHSSLFAKPFQNDVCSFSFIYMYIK